MITEQINQPDMCHFSSKCDSFWTNSWGFNTDNDKTNRQHMLDIDSYCDYEL